jgi:hypothetical protein
MTDVLIDEIFKDIVEIIREPLLVLDSDLKVMGKPLLMDCNLGIEKRIIKWLSLATY